MSDTQSSDPHQKPFVKVIYSVGVVSAVTVAVGLIADLASLMSRDAGCVMWLVR